MAVSNRPESLRSRSQASQSSRGIARSQAARPEGMKNGIHLIRLARGSIERPRVTERSLPSWFVSAAPGCVSVSRTGVCVAEPCGCHATHSPQKRRDEGWFTLNGSPEKCGPLPQGPKGPSRGPQWDPQWCRREPGEPSSPLILF